MHIQFTLVAIPLAILLIDGAGWPLREAGVGDGLCWLGREGGIRTHILVVSKGQRMLA